MKRVVSAVFGLLAAAPVPAPLSGPVLAQDASNGKTLFTRNCGGCHLDRGFGTRALSARVPAEQAKLEDRPDLTADYVQTAVRHGIGSMPAIRRSELTEAELRSIAAYLGKGK